MAGNIVATSQPLAARAGLRTIENGGNAVDAAIATAITLTVVEPVNNGIGGDAFAIIHADGKLYGINGSGKSPESWSYEYFKSKYKTMPQLGWDGVTIPGAVSVWREIHDRFGKLPFVDLFEPAIVYAERGFPVSPKTAYLWELAEKLYAGYENFGTAFLLKGRAPRVGETFRCVDMARTLREIAETGGESFYRGRLADLIASTSKKQGGMIKSKDLSSHKPFWVEPIAQSYRGYDLWEIPPNGQGIAAQIALGILNNLNLAEHAVDSADSIHIQAEAMKLAFADIVEHLADPEFMSVTSEILLDSNYHKERAKLIDMKSASIPATGLPRDRGTVYLSTADSSGMMVSFIQSNFHGFGSGVVIPGTGIAMQNRGFGFNLIEGHPNCVDGGKRPYHTIIPAFVTRDSMPVMSFGVMGGHMQPQGQVQVMARMFDYGQNPQAAIDAPRWLITEQGKLAVEPGLEPEVVDELGSRGHDIIVDLPERYFGGAQMIYKLEDCYLGASDCRKDGLAMGF